MKSKNRQILPNLRQISRDLRLRLNLARNLKTEKWCQNWRDPGLHHVVGGDWNAAETFLMVPFHALLDLRPAADRSFPLWVLTINRRSYDAGFTNMGGWGGWFPNRPKKNKSPRKSPFFYPNFTFRFPKSHTFGKTFPKKRIFLVCFLDYLIELVPKKYILGKWIF